MNKLKIGFINLPYVLIAVNLIAFLWPVQLRWSDAEHSECLLFITHYINPLILFIVLYIFLINNKIYISTILHTSFLYMLILIISSLMGAEPIKNIFISIFFILATIFIFNIYTHYYRKFPINMGITKILVIWASTPVILLLILDIQPLLIDGFENSFHGFAGGRIEYGLWTSIAILLSITYRTDLNKHILRALLILMFTGLFLSQSRASFIGLAVCLFYFVNEKYKNKLFKVAIYATAFVILISAFFSWQFHGRQNVFEFLNSTRLEIYSNYFDQLSIENIFFGFGGQNSIVLEDGRVTQAHNLLIQWLSNWGIFALLTLMLYLYLFWKSLDSIFSKMLLIFLIFYSLIQPIQGTANFFGPITLLCFLIIMGIESDQIIKKKIIAA